MTAQATVREEAPSGTKQNFGCWEEPLRNPGRGRRGAARPGPAQAQLPGGCATARRNHARPRVRGLAGGGARASRETPGPATPRGPGRKRGARARGARARGERGWGAVRAPGAGRSGDAGPGGGPRRGPLAP